MNENQHIEIDIEKIFSEIPGSPDGVGFDVSVSKVYDDIKSARFEEDSDVSFGIWERDLKKANWFLTIKLSFYALATQSKDFQILGWLLESFVCLEEFNGISKSIGILDEFIRTFWENSYPKNEDLSSDEEQKFRILDWIYDTFAKRSKFIAFIGHSPDDEVNLYNHDYAVELKNISIRSKNASQVITNAQKRGIKTIEDITNILGITSNERIEKLQKSIDEIKMARNKLVSTMESISEGAGIGIFSGLMNNLSKIENVIAPRMSKPVIGILEEPTNTPSRAEVPENNRDEIYDQIGSLAKKLAFVDRHSPSFHILNLVVSWKDRNLLEIMDDLKNGNSEAHRLLRIMAT
ncbi:MAG: type VI secretion system ImpA family N-terminal domain-containing protein [Holosporales bacterium]|jgi:type VI secretion system protein ImpA|nr:type VI secretion system ImpA family N-terminal domain-containing protein [Holosporales bacterium]